MILSTRILSGKDEFQAKFIRVGNEVYFIGPHDEVSFHIELAKKEKILERIDELKVQNPELLDGGMLYINGRVIRIGGVSTTLSLPINEKGRKNTIAVLKKQFPSYSVKELGEE